ncbi:hypothetical protein [Streptomyces glaucosporus]
MDRETAEAARKLPYSVWLSVSEEEGNASGAAGAWVAYGEPATAGPPGEAGSDPDGPADGPRQILQQVAKAHRDRIDGKRPAFTLFAKSSPSRPLCSVRPVDPGGREKEAYVVNDALGRPLCRIAGGRSPLGLRRAWTIEPEGARESFVGYRGTWAGWLLFTLFLPLWIPLTVVSVVVAVLESGGAWDGLTWGPPRRTVWRPRSGLTVAPAVLDCRRERYRRDEQRLDVRIAYAQAVLDQMS